MNQLEPFLKTNPCCAIALLLYSLGIATLRRYSEIDKPAALALARSLRSSAFVTTNRKMTSLLWLGAISGLPARFRIASSFWYYLYQVNLSLSTVTLGHPLANRYPGEAKILP